jgi:hypothetical protein
VRPDADDEEIQLLTKPPHPRPGRLSGPDRCRALRPGRRRRRVPGHRPLLHRPAPPPSRHPSVSPQTATLTGAVTGAAVTPGAPTQPLTRRLCHLGLRTCRCWPR